MFSATIDDVDNQNTWSKSIVSLSTISDHIKLVFSRQGVSISAMNQANSTFGDISFSPGFFRNFSSSGEYSIGIRSKLLSILFRKPDDDLEAYNVSLDTVKYKFLVEIRTKSMIRKQYELAYSLASKDSLSISTEYKSLYDKTFVEGTVTSDEINYLVINSSILRNFLEQTKAEDFKMCVGKEKFEITGFTKAVVRANEFLKQPMSISIAIVTEDLTALRLWSPSTKTITYRLTDFRTFVSLCGKEFPDIKIWFKTPGEPVLMECERSGTIVQFVQVTDGSSNTVMGPATALPAGLAEVKVESFEVPTYDPASVPQIPEISRVNGTSVLAGVSAPKYAPTLFVQDDEEPHFSPRKRLAEDNPLRKRHASSSSVIASESQDRVVWDPSTLESRAPDRREILHRERERYKKRTATEPEELGPTQSTTVKGIFD